MIKNAFRYTKNIVLGDKLLHDTGNSFVLVSQRAYKGKADADGNEIIKPGVTVTLQITEDRSDPIIGKDGRIQDNNVMETFDATIVGVDYPLPMNKGTQVKLVGFLPDVSYYVDFSLILRFSGIEALDAKTRN